MEVLLSKYIHLLKPTLSIRTMQTPICTHTEQQPASRKSLLPVPHPRDLGMSHLLLQLEDAEHQRFSRRRATRDIDIDWHYSITASCYRVAIVIVSSAIRAAAH